MTISLDANGRIDRDLWDQYHDFCRLVRYRLDEPDDVGHLVREQGGAFAFRSAIRGELEEETGYDFSSHRFILGDCGLGSRG